MMMRKGPDRDAVVGAVMVAAAALLFALVYSKQATSTEGAGYSLTARFGQADGITVGSAVRLSGVNVGKVVDESLDPQFRAVTTLRVAASLALPTDTAAVIQTDGLLGAKYIDLRPGAEEDTLKPGAEITYTQGSLVVEDLLEMIINQARAKRGYVNRPLPGDEQ
jgi:phospholipid/cholesterol/gamma-HCH transport system substrate-binding protein